MLPYAEALLRLRSQPNAVARRPSWPEDVFVQPRHLHFLRLQIQPGAPPVERRWAIPAEDRRARDWDVLDALPTLPGSDPLFFDPTPPPLEDPSQPLSEGAVAAWEQPPPAEPEAPPAPDYGDALAALIAGVL